MNRYSPSSKHDSLYVTRISRRAFRLASANSCGFLSTISVDDLNFFKVRGSIALSSSSTFKPLLFLVSFRSSMKYNFSLVKRVAFWLDLSALTFVETFCNPIESMQRGRPPFSCSCRLLLYFPIHLLRDLLGMEKRSEILLTVVVLTIASVRSSWCFPSISSQSVKSNWGSAWNTINN